MARGGAAAAGQGPDTPASGADSLEALEIELAIDEGQASPGHGPRSRAGAVPGSMYSEMERDGQAAGVSYLLPGGKTRRKGCCELLRRMGLRVCLGAIFIILLVAWMDCLMSTDPIQKSVQDVCSTAVRESSKVRNVVFMIPDGMGPNYLNLTKEAMLPLGKKNVLALDEILFGQIHTNSRNAEVTDSAAAATAYATGKDTFNGNVSMLNGQPLPTVLEGAEAAGMWTGLVTTARITHATPACFSAHIHDRDMENDIAEEQLNQGIEVMFGGGRRHFLPSYSPNSSREDDKNLEVVAQYLTEYVPFGHQAKGYSVIHTSDDLQSARVPVLGLFADSHLSFDMDRKEAAPDQPSLVEMTRKALQLLAGAPSGFFLMVEGGRIDHAGHYNDPVAAANEVLAYDQAVAEVLGFAKWDGATMVVSAADHETGGLFQELQLKPDYEALAAVTSSAEAIAEAISEAVHAVENDDDALQEGAVRTALSQAGVDSSKLTAGNISSLADMADEVGLEYLQGGLPLLVGRCLSQVLNVDWLWNHHTGVDIDLYAFGPGQDLLKTSMANDVLGHKVIEALGVSPAEGYTFTHESTNDDCNLA